MHKGVGMRNGCLWATALVICWASIGCHRPVSSDRYEVTIPETFSSSGSESLPQKWWESFHDPMLNDLVEEALGQNFSLQSAWDRLTQAEQVAIQAGAAVVPSVSYSLGGSRSRTETGANTTYATSLSAGLIASYEVDLWGQVKASRDAARLDVEATRETLTAAAMTLSVNVAKIWYQLIEAQQQIRLLETQVQTNQDMLGIVTLKFGKGSVKAADVLNQRQLLESNQGDLIRARQQLQLLEHQLSVLLGRIPGQALELNETAELIELPGLPETGVPLTVIQQRPDVASAFYAVRAADQRVAVAMADQYPTLSLTSNLTTTATRVEDLFDDWLVNLVAGVTGPVFDAGRRQAETRRTQAVLSAAIHNYQQTVLEAMQDVEDALTRESHQRRYWDSLQQQLILARGVYQRNYDYYANGQVMYLNVLSSLTSLQSLERAELTAQRGLIEHRIDLCRSLAASWQLDRPNATDTNPG